MLRQYCSKSIASCVRQGRGASTVPTTVTAYARSRAGTQPMAELTECALCQHQMLIRRSAACALLKYAEHADRAHLRAQVDISAAAPRALLPRLLPHRGALANDGRRPHQQGLSQPRCLRLALRELGLQGCHFSLHAIQTWVKTCTESSNSGSHFEGLRNAWTGRTALDRN